MVVFNAERYELAGHVIKRSCAIPGLERISRTLRKVRSSGKCGGPINGRQQYKVASWVVDCPAAKGDSVQVFVEPETVIDHSPHKALLGTGSASAEATYTAAAFASQVDSEGECHLVEKPLGMIVIFHQNAVVGMPARAMRRSQSVPADSVIIGNDGNVSIETPIDLHSKTETPIGLAI